jgi:hypothetical protein
MDTIEWLARLDWFERLDALLRQLSGQESWRFHVPRNCGWCGSEIEQLLKHYGVEIWDRNFTHDCLTFRVKYLQANWTEHLLRRRGIPAWGTLFNPLNEEYARRHAPGSEPATSKRHTEPHGFWGSILALLD